MAWNIHMPVPEWYPVGDHRLEAVINEVLDLDEVAIDTETTGLNIIQDLPLYWSLGWDGRRIAMPYTTLPFFQDSFRDRTKRWYFANAKFDAHMLANVGIEFAGDLVDVAVAHSLLFEEDPHGLKYMEKQLLGWQSRSFNSLFPRKPKETPGERLLRAEREGELEKVIEYATTDAFGTFEVGKVLNKKLASEYTYSLYPETYPTLAHLFFLVEVPFTKVLWKCERRGILVDQPYLKNIEGPVGEAITRLERSINRVAGRPINPSSTAQLREYFFKEKKVKPRTFTKGGKKGLKEPQVDVKFLDFQAESGDEMAELLVQHRKLSTLQGTYVKGLQARVDQHSRVHTKFNQDVARTGRLSSSDPNLQNVPRPDDDIWKLRGAFGAPVGSDLIVGDYEQLEMRLLACAAMETDMIEIFKQGRDIHMGNAELVFGPRMKAKHGWDMTYADIVQAKNVDKKVKAGELPPEAMTEHVKLGLKARFDSKSIGFGLNYGMKEGKLSKTLGCTKPEAKELIGAYLGRYRAVSQFYESAVEETRLTGYSFTLLGRRRFHPEILSANKMDRWEAERKAVNNNIQGTAADVVKLAMLACDRAGLVEKYGCHMLLQVHDELAFECPKETSAAAQATIKDLMEHPLPTDLAVELCVSIGRGSSWIHAK